MATAHLVTLSLAAFLGGFTQGLTGFGSTLLALPLLALVMDLRLATRDDAQAEAWTAAARTALSARGVAVGEVTRERSGDVRLQLELPAP